MSQTAAHLVDHVIPHVPVRQWVQVCQLRLPTPLRVLLAAQPELVTPVLQVVQRVVERHLLDHTGLKSDKGQGGAVTLIQRFGLAANLSSIQLHCLVLDGVYRCGAAGVPGFIEAGAPTDEELHALLHTVIARLMKMLMRRGVLVEEMGQAWLAEPDADGEEARTLRPLQAAAISLQADTTRGHRPPAPVRRHRRFMRRRFCPSSKAHGALLPGVVQGRRRQALAVGCQSFQQPLGLGCRAQRSAKGGEGRSDGCGVLPELTQQEGIGLLDFDAQGGQLADAEVEDVLGDEADDLGTGIEVTGQDSCCAGSDVGVFGGTHRCRHSGELGLDLLCRNLCLRQCSPHELLVATRRFGVRLAAGIDERPAHLVKDQRAPVQADHPLVVEMDQ